MNQKTLFFIYLFCAIIWTINAIITYTANGTTFLFFIHLFCAVCWTIIACLNWKQYKKNNVN